MLAATNRLPLAEVTLSPHHQTARSEFSRRHSTVAFVLDAAQSPANLSHLRIRRVSLSRNKRLLRTSEFHLEIYFDELTIVGSVGPVLVRATCVGHVHDIVRQIVDANVQITGLDHRRDVLHGQLRRDQPVLVGDRTVELVLDGRTQPVHAGVDGIGNARMPVGQWLQVLIVEEVHERVRVLHHACGAELAVGDAENQVARAANVRDERESVVERFAVLENVAFDEDERQTAHALVAEGIVGKRHADLRDAETERGHAGQRTDVT